MSAAESIARALGGRKVGSQWMACCPAHPDRNPSLAIRQDGDKVLLKDHGGCSQDAVIAALKERGLWETSPAAERGSGRRQDPIAAIYDYTDAAGRMIYQIIRRQPINGPKYFQQRYPDGHGGWIWRKHQRQVLYHLPEVLESPIVFVVEGEKDTEILRLHGFCATTNAGGAKAPWLPSFTQALAGREVILIPDADRPGRERVLKIARALLGHAGKIVVFEPDGAKDITEWFERGHSEVELIELIDGRLVSQ